MPEHGQVTSIAVATPSMATSVTAVSTSETTMSTTAVPQKKRIRAVVACSYCRSKRSKCDGVPGRQACTECQQRGIDCEMTDGKRNRGHYKPQAEALAKRVRLLEEALAESRAANQELLAERQQLRQKVQGEGGQSIQEAPQPTDMEVDDAPSAFTGLSAPISMPVLVSESTVNSVQGLLPQTTVVPATTAASIAVTMPPPATIAATPRPQTHQPSSRLVLDNGNIVFSGANSVSGTGQVKSTEVARSPHQHHPAQTTTAAGAPFPYPQDRLRPCCCADLDLSPPLVDYLLGLFFHRYQMMMKFVSQQAFMKEYALSHQNGGHHHQSPLFLAMLAAGVRYSTRRDVTARFVSGANGGENKLATAARQAVEIEISRPTLATVQTVLILCEVETSLDHQMTGYMYSCLASKLIFDMGLDASPRGLSAEETAIRHWLVWGAAVHDQFWSVFLRRPLAIKNGTLQLSRMAWRCTADVPINNHLEESPSPSFEDEVDDDLMDLMVLAREITDALYGGGASTVPTRPPVPEEPAEVVPRPLSSSPASPPYDGGGLPSELYEQAQRHADHQQRPDVAHLDARLDGWFHGLSERVRQGPVNGHSSYHYLFVLHLHYNATKIMMHRTRAFQTPSQMATATAAHPSNVPASSYPLQSPVTPPSSANGDTGPSACDNVVVTQSLATLGHAAIRMARLFERFRRREDIRILQCTGVQWAGMASEALTWYIETLPIDGAIEAVAHLQSLARTLKDMARTFLPAIYPYDRTNHAVQTFLARMDGSGDSPGATSLPTVPPPQQMQAPDALLAVSPSTGVGVGTGSVWAWNQQESWDWDELFQQQ
ncbi:hypothetical protein SEUCBS139899_001153 [Sporothrix eucalyptigena]